MPEKPDFSRRHFLKATGFVAGAAALSSTVISVMAQEAIAAETTTMAHHTAASGERAFIGKMFFTNELEFITLSEAAERIFPKDETGPGAKELGVPFFIDNQLAGAFGYNNREYRTGPFLKGTPTQGYQSALNRGNMFLQGLAALNKQANDTFKMNFPSLTDPQKDQILKMCEAGNIPAEGFESSFFFDLLKSAVMAGVYADPIYNGNRAMAGWKMKDFPGAQMEYVEAVGSKTFKRIAPVSLADM